MRDLRQYWQEVRTLERSLPEFVWLMSLEDSKRGMVGGRMAQVGAAQAAQRGEAAKQQETADGRGRYAAPGGESREDSVRARRS